MAELWFEQRYVPLVDFVNLDPYCRVVRFNVDVLNRRLRVRHFPQATIQNSLTKNSAMSGVSTIGLVPFHGGGRSIHSTGESQHEKI